MKNKSIQARWPSTSQLIRWCGTLVSSLLFIWLVSRQNWSATWTSLTSTPVWLIPLVFALYFSAMLLNSLRWDILLRSQGILVPFVEVVKIVLTGAFASNFLPSTVGGDSVRVVSLLRYKATWTLSLASVVLDRLLNVVAMVTVLPFSYLIFKSQGSNLPGASLSGVIGRLLIISGKIPAVLVGFGFLGIRMEKWRLKISSWLRRLSDILRKWLNKPGALLAAFSFSWLSSFVVFLAVWALARGLEISISLFQVMGIMALTYLVSLLPISINGYGVREVAVTTLYMQMGATLEQASTLAVVTRFMLLIETLPGALWLSQSVTPKPR